MTVLRPLLALVYLLLGALAAHAAPLRIGSAFDPQTMDPHAVALLYNSRIYTQVYEALVGRDEQFKLEPALATSWQMTGPTSWRFKLRAGVTFHDGAAFSADDVVFSIERVMAPPSERAFQLKGLTAVKKVDDLTVDFQLAAPDAVLPEKLANLAMMNKAWCEKYKVTLAQDYKAKQETFAVRNANGTGPYKLQRFEPDVRTLLQSNPAWWGRKLPGAAARNGNVDEVVFITIKQDGTRLAALTSGELDLVLDPPFQDTERLKADPQITLLQTTDLGQQYLTFDQLRPELQGSDLKGRNPFKDLRVRRAVYQAINVELIIDKVLRGQAVPTGGFLSPLVDGSPAELDKRLPFDPNRARALLAEAGYAQGFTVTMDCVNIAWREHACQAMAAMLTQVGIRVALRSSPATLFFPRLSEATTSFIEFGWTPTPDPWASLNALFRSYDKSGGGGTFNAGRYSNPRLDALIDAIRTEPELTRRRTLVGDALRLIGDELPYIPLYRRRLTWAASKKVQALIWPSDVIELRWVRWR